MKEYAKGFYHSKAWERTRELYMSSINYICERCGEPATICHHKKYITPGNIGNYDITLNFDNLEGLCQDCHNKEHSCKNQPEKAVFNEQGELIGVRESRQTKEYKKMRKEIEQMTPPGRESGRVAN